LFRYEQLNGGNCARRGVNPSVWTFELTGDRVTQSGEVPEPSTALLSLAGLGGILIYRRKRRDTRAC
jgi:hypothetical protein